MISQGRWKSCFAPGFAPVLSDLEENPGEWNDLSANASHREILRDLYEACKADGWDDELLQQEFISHKRRLAYIQKAESSGSG